MTNKNIFEHQFWKEHLSNNFNSSFSGIENDEILAKIEKIVEKKLDSIIAELPSNTIEHFLESAQNIDFEKVTLSISEFVSNSIEGASHFANDAADDITFFVEELISGAIDF